MPTAKKFSFFPNGPIKKTLGVPEEQLSEITRVNRLGQMSDFIAVQNSSVRYCKSIKDNRGTRVAKFTSQCFLCLSFYFILLITLNKPCNLIGCFVLGFTSH